MSIEICSDCTTPVDTDYKEVYDIGDEVVCEHCYEQYAETRARKDFEMGGGLEDNPYPKDSDPFSLHQRYAWEMHCLQNGGLKDIRKQIESFFRRA